METATPYKVGKYYQVPVLKLPPKENFWGMNIVPVMGHFHNDNKLLKVNVNDHIHIDWRFVSASSYGMITAHIQFDECNPANFVLGRVLSAEHYKGAVHETQRLLCKRDLPKYPSDNVYWFHAIQDKYKATTLKNGICPHQGANLSTIAPDKDNCVECPLHGLKWDLTTGKMVMQQHPIIFKLSKA